MPIKTADQFMGSWTSKQPIAPAIHNKRHDFRVRKDRVSHGKWQLDLVRLKYPDLSVSGPRTKLTWEDVGFLGEP